MPNPFDPTAHEEEREANSYWTAPPRERQIGEEERSIRYAMWHVKDPRKYVMERDPLGWALGHYDDVLHSLQFKAP